MKESFAKTPLGIFLICTITYIIAYYGCILFHEWFGHGATAWYFGAKNTPFDITYGGFALLHVDEKVDYDSLLAAHRNVAAGLIGIAGITVTMILLFISLFLLTRRAIQKNNFVFTLFFWSVVFNMVPALQYFTLTAFSNEGDVGRFLSALNISPWWAFIPGTIFVVIMLWRIFTVELPRAYAIIPIKSILGQRILLLVTLITIFLLIYTHGYNPITDKGTNVYSKILAVISTLMAPILFYICNPSRQWVKKSIRLF